MSIEHIGKVYTSKKLNYVAIKDISMYVTRGEFLSILGPSGSGKTTLLNLLGTLDRPTKGKIFIDGIDTSSMSDNQLCVIRNQKLGFIFQSYNLINYLSAFDNVMLPLIISNKDDAEGEERVRHILTQFGLGEKLNKKPNELSGGEQQRVAIARAIINNPPILLADEPTGNLDSKTAETVLNTLIDIAKKNGITIVMVTHDPEIAKFSDREIHLKDGLVHHEIRSSHKSSKKFSDKRS